MGDFTGNLKNFCDFNKPAVTFDEDAAAEMIPLAMEDDDGNHGGASSSSSSDLSVDHASLSTMTVPELKEKLRDAGLPVSGKKSNLIARIVGIQ